MERWEIERVTGIEPVAQPWEGYILPLYYTRIPLLGKVFIV